MPVCVTNVIAQILYFLIYYVLRIRRKVVKKNLQICFKDKSNLDRRHIEKAHYRYLTSLFVEMITMTQFSKEEMQNRLTLINKDLLLRHLQQHKSVILWSGHMCNMEYNTILGLFLPSVGVYKRLRNPYINQWFLRNRSRLGTQMVATKEVRDFFKHGLGHNAKGQACLIGMLADQKPGQKNSTPVHFFEQKSNFFLGPELLAERYDLPMVYMSMRPHKRGNYLMAFTDLPKLDSSFGSRTQQAAALLEQDIRMYPQYYYWLHNRWPHIDLTESLLDNQAAPIE